MVKERKQEQGIAGGNPKQEEQQGHSIFVVVSMGWLVDEFVVGIYRGSGNNKFTMTSSNVEVPLMTHRWRTPQWGVKTPIPHKPHLSSCKSSFCHGNVVQVKTPACCSLSAVQVSALCFLAFAYCNGSTRKGKSLCAHTHTLHCERTPWICGYGRHTPLMTKGLGLQASRSHNKTS